MGCTEGPVARYIEMEHRSPDLGEPYRYVANQNHPLCYCRRRAFYASSVEQWLLLLSGLWKP